MHPPIYLLPGWQDSGPGHWQTLWQQQHGDQRVLQDDWWQPRRGDWMARLEEVLLADARLDATPAVLVAHSLGCHLVAAWAAHSRHTARVAGALLVAPPDTGRADLPPQLWGWRQPLPFTAIAVLADNDPFADLAASEALARGWGARIERVGARGHLNADSGLGDWPQGRAWVGDLSLRRN
jgi:uncharacterized protein